MQGLLWGFTCGEHLGLAPPALPALQGFVSFLCSAFAFQVLLLSWTTQALGTARAAGRVLVCARAKPHSWSPQLLGLEVTISHLAFVKSEQHPKAGEQKQLCVLQEGEPGVCAQ